MNGDCRKKSKLDARSARAGIALGALLGFANAAGEELVSGAIVGAGYGGAGLIVGFVWGYCLARFFGRLRVHEERICASGLATNPGRAGFWDDHVWLAPFMWDPDFVWDLVPIPAHMHFVFDNATHPRCNDQNIGILHCEIDSAIKTAGCIGGMIGSLVGGIIGVLVLVPLLAASLFCGPLVWLCAIFAFFIAAIAAYVGSYIGALIGAAVGHLIDVIGGAGDEFESLDTNTCIMVTGRWVIDLDHGWNEIHPVEFFTPPARDASGNPLRSNCPDLCPPPVIP